MSELTTFEHGVYPFAVYFSEIYNKQDKNIEAGNSKEQPTEVLRHSCVFTYHRIPPPILEITTFKTPLVYWQ